jgi:hypothetical protein
MSDEWDFYPCRVDDKPASIFVDLGVRAHAPLVNHSDLTWLRLKIKQPRADGLTTNEEFPRLCEIDDALGAAAKSADIEIAYVGRNTCNGHRDYYFYSSNGTAAETLLSWAMVPVSEYEFETGNRHDPNWSAYLEFLYPSERNYQLIRNGLVLASLEKHSDDHSKTREVRHWVFFRASDNRDRFGCAAEENGYRVVNKWDEGLETRPFGILIAHDTAVDYHTIGNATLEIFDLGKEFDGKYDGWETSVEHS